MKKSLLAVALLEGLSVLAGNLLPDPGFEEFTKIVEFLEPCERRACDPAGELLRLRSVRFRNGRDRDLRGRVLEDPLGIWYNFRENQVKRGNVNRREFLIGSGSAAALAGYTYKEYSTDAPLTECVGYWRAL